MSGFNSSLPEKEQLPLELTVHDLPRPGGSIQHAQTRLGRLRMLLVLLVCAAPVLASYFTYYVIRPQGTRNYGELMPELKQIPAVVAKNLEGQAQPLESLKNQWLLVSVSGGQCDSNCEKHLYLQRQIRETMGKDKDRVDWVWLINDDAPVRSELLPALKAADVLRVRSDDLTQWLQAAHGQPLSAHLYLVDPMGQWMMRFPAQPDPYKIKADLERLLKASASWDKAGR